jgi:TldD protein
VRRRRALPAVHRLESFGFDDGRLKTADYSRDAGFGLRGVSGEMTGSPTPTRSRAAHPPRRRDAALLDPAKGSPRRAAAAPTATSTPTPPARRRAIRRQGQAARARSTPPPAPAIPRVAQVSASLSGSWSVVEIVRADGFVAHDIRRLSGLTSASSPNRTAAARP